MRDIYFVRYEDLVADTEKEMRRVASFVNVNYEKNLLEPTTAGNVWKGNASNDVSLEKVSGDRNGKWKAMLDNDEVCVLETALHKYFDFYGYHLALKKNNMLQMLCSMKLKFYGSPNVSTTNPLKLINRWLRFVCKIVHGQIKWIFFCFTQR